MIGASIRFRTLGKPLFKKTGILWKSFKKTVYLWYPYSDFYRKFSDKIKMGQNSENDDDDANDDCDEKNHVCSCEEDSWCWIVHKGPGSFAWFFSKLKKWKIGEIP